MTGYIKFLDYKGQEINSCLDGDWHKWINNKKKFIYVKEPNLDYFYADIKERYEQFKEIAQKGFKDKHNIVLLPYPCWRSQLAVDINMLERALSFWGVYRDNNLKSYLEHDRDECKKNFHYFCDLFNLLMHERANHDDGEHTYIPVQSKQKFKLLFENPVCENNVITFDCKTDKSFSETFVMWFNLPNDFIMKDEGRVLISIYNLYISDNIYDDLIEKCKEAIKSIAGSLLNGESKEDALRGYEDLIPNDKDIEKIIKQGIPIINDTSEKDSDYCFNLRLALYGLSQLEFNQELKISKIATIINNNLSNLVKDIVNNNKLKEIPKIPSDGTIRSYLAQ